jgi:predicted ATP-dependent endonuclease of OLD family
MRLRSVRVKEFRSVWDSGIFEVGDVVCLVGKNEAGKTAVLQALYRLNPIIEADAKFNVTLDYPKLEVEDYEQDVEAGRRDKQTAVISATFTLTDQEMKPVKEAFGDDVFACADIILSRGYTDTYSVTIRTNDAEAAKAWVEAAGLPNDVKAEALKQPNFEVLLNYLNQDSEQRQKAHKDAVAATEQIDDATEKAAALDAANSHQESEAAKRLRAEIAPVVETTLAHYIWLNYLTAHFPRFLYFDEYYQMTGQLNVEKLKERQAGGTLAPSDHPMLGLIELARLNLDQLIKPTNTQFLKNKLLGTSNHLSGKILRYWSQNKHLHVQFDVRPALAGDPDGMNVEGTTNLWGEVFDSAHGAVVPLGTRSRGFVWFFSFLAWFSQQKKSGKPMILLLDEPGLLLHASAQADLLNYIEQELKPYHQVIYTTHSPFMVDANNFDRVRIVRDRSMEENDPLPADQRGTKVFTDILEADPDSLFPLQSALGYDIAQTLFIGPNSLIVEGVSDLLYLPTIGGVLSTAGREALSAAWTITPVGGSDKIPTFVSLMGSQKKLKVAMLIDYQKKDQQSIENIYKKKLLARKNVHTFAQYTGKTEADIEDMFDQQFFLDLVNAEYKAELPKPIELKDLGKHPRILVNIEGWLKANPLKIDGFNHYRPARYFAQNIGSLGLKLDSATLDRFESVFKALNALL